MEDIISIDEMEVIAVSRWWRWIKFNDATKVSNIKDAKVTHQYIDDCVSSISASKGIIIFNIC